MKRLGVYAIIPILFASLLSGFTTITKTYAAVTDKELLDLSNQGTNFEQENPNFAERWVRMVKSVGDRLKNDPDVGIYDIKQYVLNGIPGASNANQQGFIPLVKGVINGNTNNALCSGFDSEECISRAKLILANANLMLSAANLAAQKVGGVLSAQEQTAQLNNAIQSSNKAYLQELSKKNEKQCSLLTESPIINCIDVAVTYIIKTVLLELAGWFLWLTANILNYAMKIGIFEFKMFAPDTIYGMWLVVRQTVSLFIFFAGLFIGFMSVIGKSEEFKKFIAFFVVFGLFVNFSYPVIRLMIDVSNIVSLQIYETTLGSGVILANTDGPETAGARIVSALGLNGLAAGATTLPGSGATSDFIKQITTTPGALLAVIFVAYSGYVLFMMAALIIARTVLLVFLIIASPLLLVDTVVPALGEKAAWLRKQFFSQLAVAPVFTIMLALTLRFLEVFQTTGIVSMTGTQASSIVIFFNIAIMLAMMHITLKVTKSVAGSIGEGVTAWAGKAGGLATGMAFRATAGATGFVGRQTVGRAAGALAQTDTVKNWAGTWMGDTVGKGLSKVGGAKYDLRNLTTVGKATGFAGMRGMGAGVGQSFAEQQTKNTEAIIEQAKGMTDDTARQAFLDRKLGRGSILKDPLGEVGARVGNKVATKLGFDMPQTATEKTRSAIEQGDADTLKKYASANKKERERMMADDKNKAYQNRFAQVDTYLDPKTPQANKDAIKATLEKNTPGAANALQAGEQKQAEIKARNEARLADYGTADAAGREAIRTAFANDEEALQQIYILQKLSAIKSDFPEAVTQKTEELKKLKELAGEDMVFKVISRDTHEGITDRNAAIAQKAELYQNVFTDPVTGSVDPRVSTDPFVLGQQYDEAIAKRDGVNQAATKMKQAEIDALKLNAQASQDLAKMLQQSLRGGAFRQSQQTQTRTQTGQQGNTSTASAPLQSQPIPPGVAPTPDTGAQILTPQASTGTQQQPLQQTSNTNNPSTSGSSQQVTAPPPRPGAASNLPPQFQSNTTAQSLPPQQQPSSSAQYLVTT